ncbi:MAG TPA: hypothetical protein VFZ45_01665 [Actinomycetota bacterium]|nr:hypothetical protein [Actinomycetota bacterium]
MIVGFLLGFILGLAVAPVIRSWILWREHQEARREALLYEETIHSMRPHGPASRWPRPARS